MAPLPWDRGPSPTLENAFPLQHQWHVYLTRLGKGMGLLLGPPHANTPSAPSCAMHWCSRGVQALLALPLHTGVRGAWPPPGEHHQHPSPVRRVPLPCST